MQVLTGRCLCEGVEYRIEGELGPIFNCHCSRCRRWHGAAFRTRASIKSSQFSWVKGRDLVKSYHSSEFTAKHFCGVCGSNLVSTYDNDPERMSLPLGGLDQAPSNKPEGHFFVGSKAPWFDITDGLPQNDTWPGSREVVRTTSGEAPAS
ncbi:MAG TPA: GFA family protein [Burkholderiaceae bacterium]|nr:GFA family protein [Burkholderiaceae bacterium]